MSQVIEATGSVDEHGHLELDGPLAAFGPRRVRVLVLLQDDQTVDIPEREWLSSAARNPAFAFLADPKEDVYSARDGKPFHDQG